jgi:hypothetical protein
MTEQDIAHRAAAERRHAAEQADANPVHRSAAGGQSRRHRLDNDGENVESVKQQAALSHHAVADAAGGARLDGRYARTSFATVEGECLNDCSTTQ